MSYISDTQIWKKNVSRIISKYKPSLSQITLAVHLQFSLPGTFSQKVITWFFSSSQTLNHLRIVAEEKRI